MLFPHAAVYLHMLSAYMYVMSGVPAGADLPSTMWFAFMGPFALNTLFMFMYHTLLSRTTCLYNIWELYEPLSLCCWLDEWDLESLAFWYTRLRPRYKLTTLTLPML